MIIGNYVIANTVSSLDKFLVTASIYSLFGNQANRETKTSIDQLPPAPPTCAQTHDLPVYRMMLQPTMPPQAG